MTTFEKIGSGMPGLDRILDNIRIGDNVVWQVSSTEDYARMAELFADQAIRDGRNLIYIRFAPHPPILGEREGLRIHRLDPSLGFEQFTGEVHRIVKEAGREAFYVFDSLSELQTAWAADLMMGNFFVVTCPYLFELDTVAWFCILRHRHSFDAIARIRDTTQILLDLYRDRDCLYVHPIKVWKRYSTTMFFPHRFCPSEPDRVLPITDGVSTGRFYELAGATQDPGGELNLDSWERFFMESRESGARGAGEDGELVRRMAERLIGQERRMLEIVMKHCSVEDLLAVKDRMIGSGKIGGKAAGMLVARRIVRKNLPRLAVRLEPHDSFYVGSDIFYTYIVQNRLWRLRVAQRSADGYYSEAPALRDGMLKGTFPDRMREQFARMLEYFGQAPIIVRSSSLLEDSFGHAFAGKYESVFCANTGSSEDRLAAFESAVRTVYASSMNPSALAYRQNRGLDGMDEQMAILVQRVSGSLFGGFFMPALAGVGYSFNNWRWNRDIDPKAGMVRLVIGLGTRAVERTDSDYPRIASLDRPELDPSGPESRSWHCQRSVDGLDLASCSFSTRPLDEIMPLLPEWLAGLLVERDYGTERILAERGITRSILIGTCSGALANKELIGDLRAMLGTLEKSYGNPVDVEFTVNWAETGEYLVNLLQCRPLQSSPIPEISDQADAGIETISERDVFFRLTDNTMGPHLAVRIGAIILIDPRAYFELPWRDKSTVARCVGAANFHYRGKKVNAMLLAPGRLGTTSPELGIPVSFAEIGHFKVLCEVAYSAAGYSPELSWGSHFFQDLVEAGISYAAIPEEAGRAGYRADLLDGYPDRTNEIIPDNALPPGLIRILEPDDLWFFSDPANGSCLCARMR